MGRRAVEIEVVLIDVLAVIPFAVGETEEAVLQDRIAAVPQRDRKAQALLIVGHAGQPVFTPPVGARAGLIVREVRPRIAVVAVVFANSPPLALAEVRSPLPPGKLAVARVNEALLF